MFSQVYFNEDDLKRGIFFQLTGDITTEHEKKYKLIEWIARGGNGVVFKCYDVLTGEEFAVKFLMKFHRIAIKRFLRETKLLRDSNHLHLISYVGSGRVKSKPNKKQGPLKLYFVVMELAEKNLQQLIDSENISYEQYSGQFRGLARALSKLHEYAIHRDIKPENILVVRDRWLLSDYGLCTSVAEDEEEITPDGQNNIGPKFWLSPEAYNRRLGRGDIINAQSDVFQLASVFWFVVTGRHPSGVITESDWQGPSKLYHVLYKSLLHDSKKRPKDGHEFASSLEQALAD